MQRFHTLLFVLANGLAGAVSAQFTLPDSTHHPLIVLDPMLIVDTIRADSADNGRYIYHLRNGGDAALVIANVQSSDPCFCSVWPKEPVLPGRSAELVVDCPPAHAGTQQQSFSILSNAAPLVFRLKRFRPALE